MARLPALTFEELTPEQKKLWQEIGANRNGSPGGPFQVWMNHPKIAERAHHFGNAVRTEGQLEKRLFELVVLAVARHWSAQYVFTTHARYARQAGVLPEVIDAIRTRRTPAFTKDDERIVYDTVCELLDAKRLSDDSYNRALGLLGRDKLIELVATIGFYVTAAATVNAFDMAPRNDEAQLT
jgi:4-carboxymuconolactone decarboxylase